MTYNKGAKAFNKAVPKAQNNCHVLSLPSVMVNASCQRRLQYASKESINFETLPLGQKTPGEETLAMLQLAPAGWK